MSVSREKFISSSIEHNCVVVNFTFGCKVCTSTGALFKYMGWIMYTPKCGTETGILQFASYLGLSNLIWNSD